MQTEMAISGSAWFEGNAAHDGGAIMMLDQSAVRICLSCLSVSLVKIFSTHGVIAQKKMVKVAGLNNIMVVTVLTSLTGELDGRRH